MLKKRTRSSSNKQGLMSEYRPVTSIFPSPRLFVGISGKGFCETEAVKSPTSTLESKPFSTSLFSDRSTCKSMPESAVPSSENKCHYGPIGLGIVDALKEEETKSNSLKHENRKVLFGSHLKIQIPTLLTVAVPRTGAVESPHSPIEFGIKTMNTVLGLKSVCARSSPAAKLGAATVASPRVCTGTIPASEMELSEDYTCVIMHGPNPRTTHIFDNCIIEDCEDWCQGSSVTHRPVADQPRYPSEKFLSFCHTCKKDLRQGKDIYIYRGEKAFCSGECRYQEILFDEGSDKQLCDGL